MLATPPCEQSAAGPVCEDVARVRLLERCMIGGGYALDRQRLDERIHSDARLAWRTAANESSVWRAPGILERLSGKRS